MLMNSKKPHKVRIWFKDFSNPWKTKYRQKTIENFVVVDEYGTLFHDETKKKLETILKVTEHNERLLITSWQILDFAD